MIYGVRTTLMTETNGTHREQLFDLLVSRLSEFVIVLAGADGHFTSWHQAVEQLFGYSQDEFIGLHSDILLPLPDRLRGSGKRELERAAESGCASDTRPLVTKNGRQIMVEGVTIALRSGGGDLVGFGKVLRDVTKQKATQDELVALTRALDQSPIIVRRWDGTIDHWTTGCQRLYGWTAQEAIGQSCQGLLQTSFPYPSEEIQKELLLTGMWKGEVVQIKKDGTAVNISAHWALLTDAGNVPLSIIESQIDITPRIAIQRELEAANQKLQSMALELERSNEELEEFARIASHDLSAPITSTRWVVEMLSSRHSGGLDEAGRRCIVQISQGLDRMAELVEAVLAHARVGTSAISSVEFTHCEDALGVAIDNLRKHIDVSGAVIDYDSLPSVEVKLQALSQLFQNLLSNAIKYRRKDVTPLITIKAEWNSPLWTISVADHGIGIEPEWFERIFQPMQRRDGLEVAGSGIGLATCKKIVSRVGGSIWVESQLGSGSTFYCTLPGPAPELQPEFHARPEALDVPAVSPAETNRSETNR